MSKKKDDFKNAGFALTVTSHTFTHLFDSLLPLMYVNMKSDLNLSTVLLGLTIMGYKLSSAMFQLLMGFLGRFFRRKLLLSFGTVLQAIFNALTGISPRFEHLFVFRTVAGIGSSPHHPTGFAYIAENFSSKKTGKAMGINMAIAQFGAVITPTLGGFLLLSIGWRLTLILFSIPAIVIGILFLLVKEKKRPQKWMGISSFKYLFKDTREILKNRIVLMALIVETVMSFGIGMKDFLPTYFELERGFTGEITILLFTVFLAASVPAPYFWGYLSDKIERRKVVMLAMGTLSVFWLILSYKIDLLYLFPILIILGFARTGTGAVILAFVANSISHEKLDVVYGIYFTVAFSIGSTSPVIIGYLADTFSFSISFIGVALTSLSAMIAAYFLKSKK